MKGRQFFQLAGSLRKLSGTDRAFLMMRGKLGRKIKTEIRLFQMTAAKLGLPVAGGPVAVQPDFPEAFGAIGQFRNGEAFHWFDERSTQYRQFL
jgi:hypothetical protein